MCLNKSRLCTLLAALLLCVATQAAALAQTAQVQGRIYNKETGAYIYQAEVALVGTPAKTTTNQEGAFTLRNLTPGQYTLTAAFVDFATYTSNITLSANQTLTLDIPLESSVYQLGEVVITSQREGDAVSILRRKNSDNLVNVVSMDAYGTVADGNIGNILINIAGLASTQPGGEVQGITFRGMAPELNAVTVDGVRAAATVGGNSSSTMGDRAVLLDQIPSEFIKEIEITKALLPQQPADSLGGAINLVQKHPSDFKRRVVTYSAGLFYNTYRDDNHKLGPNFAFTYIDKLGASRKFSYSISASYNKQANVPFDNIQATYNSEYTPLNYQPIDENDPLQPGYPLDPTANSVTAIRMLAGQADRVRAGTDFAAVYELDRTARIWLKGRYTYFTSNMTRTDYRFGGDLKNATYDASVDDNITTVTDAVWRNAFMREDRKSTQYMIMAGIEKEWHDSSITLRTSYNPSKFTNHRPQATAFMNEGNLTVMPLSERPIIVIDTSNRQFPTFTQTSGASVDYSSTDFNKYNFECTTFYEETEEQMTNVHIDYDKRFYLYGVPIKFRTGADYRRQHRLSHYTDVTWLYRPVDADGDPLDPFSRNIAQFMTGQPGYGLFNGRYASYDVINLDYAIDYLHNNSGNFIDYQGRASTTLPPSSITEGVMAGYAQAHLDFGKISVIGGVRYEWTDVNSQGSSYKITGRSSTQLVSDITTTTHSSSYGEIFPSLHLRYAPAKNLVFRAAISAGMARPALKLIVPTVVINNNMPDDGTERGSITVNNPNLKPQYSTNYDLSAEYYIEPGGIFSVGVFRKNLENFLAPTRTRVPDGPDNGFNGDYADYRYSTWINMGDAKVTGLELEYKQRFTFLPKPLNGLYFFGSYTRLNTEGTYNNNATELVGFIPEVWALGATFTWKKFEFRAIWRRNSDNLKEYSNIQQDIFWRRAFQTWDFNVQYTFRPQLAFYIDLVNAFNKSPDEYSQIRRRVQNHGVSGARLNFGIKGRF